MTHRFPFEECPKGKPLILLKFTIYYLKFTHEKRYNSSPILLVEQGRGSERQTVKDSHR